MFGECIADGSENASPNAKLAQREDAKQGARSKDSQRGKKTFRQDDKTSNGSELSFFFLCCLTLGDRHQGATIYRESTGISDQMGGRKSKGKRDVVFIDVI